MDSSGLNAGFINSRQVTWMSRCCTLQPYAKYAHIIIYIGIVAVIEERSFVDLLSLLGAVQFKQNVSSVNVGLGVVSTHADSLSIQQVSFFQSCFVTGNQICQVQEHIQVIRCNASLVRLTWFCFWKQ